MLVVLNFSSSVATTNIAIDISNAKLLLINYKNAPEINQAKKIITLKTYEAVVYKL